MRFTREEKTILVSILAAAIAGLAINLIFSYNKKLTEKPASSVPLIININTASESELDRLPGVGKVIAGRIVEYRGLNKGFKSIEELAKVKGITKSKLEKIRKFVSL
jgi:competence ComEA-like helix-hairpin-helix protein